MTLSIRLRLTIWFTVAAAGLLAVVGTTLSIVHQHISLGRLDAELRRLNDAVATVLRNELVERPGPQAAAEEALVEVVVPGRHLAILTTQGAVLAVRWKLPSSPAAGAAPDRTFTIDGPPRARVVSRSLAPVPPGFLIVTAASWEELDADHADLVRALLLVIPIALVVTAGGAWWVAGRALTPAAAMAAEAERLTEHSAGGRLTVARQDELGRLATAFNGLVSRLEAALAVRRQFLADASHELRTPVSVARTAADVALSRADRSSAEYRDSLEIVSAQMKHLGRIVADMLTLARSDAPDWPLATSDFYLDELVAEAVRTMAHLARDGGVAVSSSCPAELQARGDEALLHQLLVNLLENAIRHTPPGGSVRLSVTVAERAVVVSIEDTGRGIPETERERIFDRFFRAGAAAGEVPRRDGSGTGLGLAIARRIARAHGGDLTLVSTGPSGSHFAATLPIASA